MTKLKHFIFNDFQVNGFVLYDETGEAIIIDGAVNSKTEQNQLIDFINKNELKPKYIISTHGHLDHICGNAFLKSTFDIPILINEEDNFWVERAMDQAAMYDFPMQKPPMPDNSINDGEIIKFGDSILKALHIPGHSPGSIAFYCQDCAFVISGDTLFNRSIGRTDFPKGNHKQLLDNISEKLFSLPPDTLVLPGHGPETSIRIEKSENSFFRQY